MMNYLAETGASAMDAIKSALGMDAPPKKNSIPPMQKVAPEEQARLDAMARQNGYENYEQMRAFLLRRQMAEGGTVTGQRRAPAGLDTAMAIHPRSLLNYSADALKKVNDR